MTGWGDVCSGYPSLPAQSCPLPVLPSACTRASWWRSGPATKFARLTARGCVLLQQLAVCLSACSRRGHAAVNVLVPAHVPRELCLRCHCRMLTHLHICMFGAGCDVWALLVGMCVLCMHVSLDPVATAAAADRSPWLCLL